MSELFTYGSVGRAPGNWCLYPEAEITNPPAKPGWQYNYVHFIAHSAGSNLIYPYSVT